MVFQQDQMMESIIIYKIWGFEDLGGSDKDIAFYDIWTLEMRIETNKQVTTEMHSSVPMYDCYNDVFTIFINHLSS